MDKSRQYEKIATEFVAGYRQLHRESSTFSFSQAALEMLILQLGERDLIRGDGYGICAENVDFVMRILDTPAFAVQSAVIRGFIAAIVSLAMPAAEVFAVHLFCARGVMVQGLQFDRSCSLLRYRVVWPTDMEIEHLELSPFPFPVFEKNRGSMYRGQAQMLTALAGELQKLSPARGEHAAELFDLAMVVHRRSERTHLKLSATQMSAEISLAYWSGIHMFAAFVQHLVCP